MHCRTVWQLACGELHQSLCVKASILRDLSECTTRKTHEALEKETMSHWSIFATVAVAHFLALLSPGPDFLLVVKSAVKNSACTAMGVAVGIAVANAVYIALCLMGVGALLSGSATLMVLLKIAGGLFLTYCGAMALKAKKADYAFLTQNAAAQDGVNSAPSTFFKEFALGLASGLLNPKNLLFYLSLFTLVLHNGVETPFKVALGVWMTLVVLAWDAMIILLLTQGFVRHAFNRCAYFIDKIAGVVLGAIGIKIVHSAVVQ